MIKYLFLIFHFDVLRYLEKVNKALESKMSEKELAFSRKLRVLKKKYGDQIDLSFLGIKNVDDGVQTTVPRFSSFVCS